MDELRGHGHLLIHEKSETNFLAASFAPDGSAIATSGQSGEVTFYKISFQRAGDCDNNGDEQEGSAVRQSVDSCHSETDDSNATPKQMVNRLVVPDVVKEKFKK